LKDYPEAMSEVTAKDWFKCGFNDGQHGNPKFPPSGTDAGEARKEYLRGYLSGRAELRAMKSSQ
jgi:hypothetical protein